MTTRNDLGPDLGAISLDAVVVNFETNQVCAAGRGAPQTLREVLWL